MKRLNKKIKNFISQNSTEKSNLFDLGLYIHQNLYNYVSMADAKAFGLIVLNIGLITLLIDNQSNAILVVCWISIFFYIVSTLISIFAIFPRLPSGKNSLIFWEDIRGRNCMDSYVNDFLNSDNESIEKDFAEQNWYVSHVLHRKYNSIQWSISVFLIGSFLAIISIWG